MCVFCFLVLSFLFFVPAPARSADSALSMKLCQSVVRERPKTSLYSEIPEDKVKKGWMKVSDDHELYYEESGNPNGKPVLFVHGGPGAGAKPGNRRFFDPAKWRIINLSQRASPPSKFKDPMMGNNTWNLIDDFEQLRVLLKIDRWTLFGGSWGSTLSLAYAISHPDRVEGMILRGIYLGRLEDSDWYFHQEQDPATASKEWKTIHALLDPKSKEPMDLQLYQQIMSPDRAVRLRAKRAWLEYSDTIYRAQYAKPDEMTDEEVLAITNPAMEALFAVKNAYFPTRNYILENIHKLRKIPAVIIHGMSDRATPLGGAIALSQVWPEAELIVVPGAGHAADEPGTLEFLVDATNRFADLHKEH